MTQKKRQLSHFLNFYVFLTVELPEELVWERPALSTRYFDDDRSWVIVGHTPTLSISGKAEICCGEQLIMIDCGAVYPGGRLACLCLDTMEVFYVG